MLKSLVGGVRVPVLSRSMTSEKWFLGCAVYDAPLKQADLWKGIFYV